MLAPTTQAFITRRHTTLTPIVLTAIGGETSNETKNWKRLNNLFDYLQ